MDIDPVLRGEHGQEGLAALLTGEGRGAVLAAARSMLAGDGDVRDCRVTRAHLKPGRRLQAWYDLTVGSAPPVPVAVTWVCTGVSPKVDELAPAEAELRTAALAAGTPQRWARWCTLDPRTSMQVLVPPLDPTFPNLAARSDPRRVGAALHDCGLAESAGASAWTVQPLRYRPGQRHVLAYHLGRHSFFVKLYRPGTGAAVVTAADTLAGLVEASGIAGMRPLRPAATLDGGDTIVYRHVSGTPISQFLSDGPSAVATSLRDLGRALRALHALEPPASASLPVRDMAGEVHVVLRTCGAMAALRPDLGSAAAAAVDDARARLERVEQEAPRVVHGDMKADHVLVAPGGLTLLDPDRCSLGDPAYDLGKTMADLRCWSLGRGLSGAPAAEAELLAGYGAAGPRLERAREYARLLLVRMAARRVPLWSRDWAERTATILESATGGGEARSAA
jgi:Ser/Thr protein kinase RdoA (MazF antagonist)